MVIWTIMCETRVNEIQLFYLIKHDNEAYIGKPEFY